MFLVRLKTFSKPFQVESRFLLNPFWSLLEVPHIHTGTYVALGALFPFCMLCTLYFSIGPSLSVCRLAARFSTKLFHHCFCTKTDIRLHRGEYSFFRLPRLVGLLPLSCVGSAW